MRRHLPLLVMLTVAVTVALSMGVALVLVRVADTATMASCHYRARGAFPDKKCTPGALNPAVKQSTIGKTICVPGWTRTVRPPFSYTNSLKRTLLAAYGQPLVLSRYELDHLVALELGGAPSDPRNLWPEPYEVPIVGKAGAGDKDVVENRLKRLVCKGTVTLARARYLMRHDWRKSP